MSASFPASTIPSIRQHVLALEAIQMSDTQFRQSYISTSTHHSTHTAESSSSTKPIISQAKVNNTAKMSDIDPFKHQGNNVDGDNTTIGASSAAPKRPVDEPLVKIQPPKREDLQPSYARAIKPDDADSDDHGWYGSMINSLGACMGTLGAIPCCIVCPVSGALNPLRRSSGTLH